MKRLGIETGADLKAQSREFLAANFGSSADWYHGIARGIDDRPVNPSRERKSSGSETTFDRDLIDPAEIEAGVLRMADDVANWCAQRQMFGRTVTVKAKFADFRQVTRSRTSPAAVTDAEQLRATAIDLIRTLYPVQLGIRLVGVTVSNFAASEADKAMPLFAQD
jgi:DNA polymerase-4